MKIDINYLTENALTITHEVESMQMISGAFALMSEEEIVAYAEQLLESGNLDEYIAFAHIHGGVPLNEEMVRYVNSSGETGIRKSREVRSKLAYKTTSLSKAKRVETAIKASKTRSSNPSTMTRANRKRRKANRKRSSLGYDQ